MCAFAKVSNYFWLLSHYKKSGQERFLTTYSKLTQYGYYSTGFNDSNSILKFPINPLPLVFISSRNC